MINLMKLFLIMIIMIKYFILIINKLNFNKMKMNYFTSIECGFNQMNNKHLPLYNNFLIILIIFLIFDLEFFLLIPLIIIFKKFNWIKLNLLMIMIILFIYFTLIYEIKMNCINWIK